MSPHCCSYCLKAIATKPGIKWHIAQSPACRDHWEKLIEWTHFAASNGEDDQTIEETNDDAPPYEWVNEFNELDGPNVPLEVPEGHLVHQSHIDIVAGPPDLCEPPSKHVRVEADEGDSPSWLTSGRFTEKYTGIAATTLGRGKTIFKALEVTELKKDDSEWVPFCDEDEWHLV